MKKKYRNSTKDENDCLDEWVWVLWICVLSMLCGAHTNIFQWIGLLEARYKPTTIIFCYFAKGNKHKRRRQYQQKQNISITTTKYPLVLNDGDGFALWRRRWWRSMMMKISNFSHDFHIFSSFECGFFLLPIQIITSDRSFIASTTPFQFMYRQSISHSYPYYSTSPKGWRWLSACVFVCLGVSWYVVVCICNVQNDGFKWIEPHSVRYFYFIQLNTILFSHLEGKITLLLIVRITVK